MPFHAPINNVPPDPIGAPITVTASRATGANPLHVSNGALFGSPTTVKPLWVSVFRAGFPVTVLEVTGNASNVLTVTGPAPSMPDAACNVGDTVMICPTADNFIELQTAIGAVTPGGATGDLQWKNGAVFAGGGPTWTPGTTTLNVTGEIKVTTNLTAPQVVIGGSFVTSGAAAGYTLTRRDTGVQAWSIASVAADYGVYNISLGTYGITISGANNAVTFSGPVSAGAGLAVTGNITAAGNLSAVGATAAYVINRRDTNAIGWQFFSGSGDLNFYNSTAAGYGLIFAADNSATFYNNVTVTGQVIATGYNSALLINRRDTYANAWTFFSGSGELNLYSYTAGAYSLKIDGASSAATFLGTVRTGTGATGARPTGAVAGAQWYDTTLGKPVWFNGSVWKDAAGNTV
jgi:hypothetical protein